MIDHLNDSNISPSSNLPETNLCGYDSFLHATICTNANNNLHNIASPQPHHTSPAAIVTPHRISSNGGHHHHHKQKFTKTKTHQTPPQQMPVTSTTVTPQQQQQNRTKLNTSNVNHLNPNLSAEQKLSRTINHVEKWLTDRDQPMTHKNDKNNHSQKIRGVSKLGRSKSKEELPVKEKSHLKLIDDGEKASRKTPKSHISSAKTTPEHLNNKIKQGLMMEYASIPVNADPSECENLLRCSDEDTNNTSATPSTVHRYVHEHIHHHYHHFENDEV